MHIWHHAYHLPKDKQMGVNFGLTLSIWDYIFRTDYIPYSGKDIKLGFPGVEKFPHGFAGQNVYGILNRKEKNALEQKPTEKEAVK
jgi:sterol desaturase/sphingolipid hydroxylase (fatty acid hydroxylase superfamily)